MRPSFLAILPLPARERAGESGVELILPLPGGERAEERGVELVLPLPAGERVGERGVELVPPLPTGERVGERGVKNRCRLPSLQPNATCAHPIDSDMMTAVMEERPSAMARAAAGDADAFALLIEPLLDPAYRLAAVMLSDRTAAEDAVQEGSIKAWRKLRQLRGDAGSLRPWFLSIVANECRMTRRRHWWSVVKLAAPPPAPSAAWRGAEGGT